jgi:hypothetical protein
MNERVNLNHKYLHDNTQTMFVWRIEFGWFRDVKRTSWENLYALIVLDLDHPSILLQAPTAKRQIYNEARSFAKGVSGFKFHDEW